MTDTTTADMPGAPLLALRLEHWAEHDEGLRGDDMRTAAITLRRLHALAAQEAKPEELQIAPVNNEAGSTMSIVRWQIETPAGLVGSYRREALEYLLGARAQDAEDAARYHRLQAGCVAVPVGDLEELAASIKGDCYMGQEWETKCIKALLAGAVADRKDAERYQWLRDQGALTEGSRHPHSWRCIRMLSDMGGEHADAAIDAARAKEGKARAPSRASNGATCTP